VQAFKVVSFHLHGLLAFESAFGIFIVFFFSANSSVSAAV